MRKIGYVSSIFILVFGLWLLLKGMSYPIEFIGLSQIVKVLSLGVIFVGGIGLFATINYGKW